jgi:heptaprenyl diphosphate synthase
MIPKPLPFMRIGLANLPLMLALDLFPLKTWAPLVLVKIAGQGIITGSLFSPVFLFSLAGSLSSAALMYPLRRITTRNRSFWRLSLAGIGAAAAFCSNGTQLLLARFLVFGEGVRYLIPPFLAAALFSGFTLGMFCEIFIAQSRWYALRRGGPAAAEGTDPAPPGPAALPAAEPAPDGEVRGDRGAARSGGAFRRRREEAWNRLFRPGELCAAGLIMALCFLFNPSVPCRALQFLAFWLFSWLSGKKQRPLVTLLTMLCIAGCNLLAPYGRVLASWGPFSLSTGSLRAGIQRAVTLEGLFMLSAACVRRGLRFPGSFGALLGDTLGMLERLQTLAGAPGPGGLRGRGRGTVVSFIDGILTALDRDEPEPPRGKFREQRPQETRRRPPCRGRLLLLLMILAAGAAPFITGRIVPEIPF